MIDALAGQGISAKRCCRLLGVSASGYFYWKHRAPSERELRRQWLSGLISEIHTRSRGTYGYRRMTAELKLGLDMRVNHKLVARLMAEQGLYGLPKRKARRSGPNSDACVAEDLVHRQFSADAPDRLWLTDITEHPTREGKLYCCVVLDAFARKVVGWSIDTRQDAALVTNALGMATASRMPGSGSIVHSDRGCQFTSWAFSQKVKDAGLAPSMGQVGSAFDNAMMESFWGRVQTELLDRRKWRTRLELANELFEYLEVFYNKQRRHSSLEMLTPDEYETLRAPKAIAA